ncbi:O-antigen ligase family protein [Clostridium beijerinckii]|uniref:O-antigen ligase family protein n=1 Tax=Clostridium beijerinckii TaxID=1520 RepID=UPI00156E472E|nr:O-antigen ligase family protein [Clostridium beijerinckii]NRT70246.1 hypothetical protein [Clostridium beijerinckii]
MTLKIFFSIFLLIPLIFVNKLYFRYQKYYYNISFILIFICFNFYLRTNYLQYLLDGEEFLYIPIALILMIIIYISTIKIKKITFDNVLIFFILTSFFLNFNSINNKIKFWSAFFGYFSIFIIGIIYKNIEEYDYKKIIDLFPYVAIYNGALGILQFITNKKLLIGMFNDDIYYQQGGEYVKRVVGIAGTNNAAGNLGAILFAVVCFCYIDRRNKKNFIAVIFTLIFSILTLTRIGYLAMGLELIIYFIFTKWDSFNKIAKKTSIIILGGIFFGIVLIIFGDQIRFILFEQRGSTANSRIEQFTFIFNNIIKYNIFWTGIGPGQYRDYAYYYFGYTDLDIHSQYINLLVENGWVICFIFLIFNIYICRIAIKKCDDALQRSFIIALFVGNLVCMNFNPNQYYIVNNWIYYLLMYCFVYKKK